MLGLTPNGPGRKIRRWSLGRLGRVDLYFERDITVLLAAKTLHFWPNGKSVYETDLLIYLKWALALPLRQATPGHHIFYNNS
jgi:hypothetical protein